MKAGDRALNALIAERVARPIVTEGNPAVGVSVGVSQPTGCLDHLGEWPDHPPLASLVVDAVVSAVHRREGLGQSSAQACLCVGESRVTRGRAVLEVVGGGAPFGHGWSVAEIRQKRTLPRSGHADVRACHRGHSWRNNGDVDEDEVAQQLRSRTDPASQAAVARLAAGGKWWSGVQVVKVASELREWSRPDEDPHSDLEIIGLEELLAALAATRHATLDEATLDHEPPGAGLGDRFLVYLVPGTSEVVACVGVVPAPRPPLPVYRREEVPDTVGGLATAWLSYHHQTGQPAPFEVTVRRELDSAETERLYSAWPQRTKGFYSQGPDIRLVGAAEVSVREPKGQRFEGYLLILDVAPDPDVKRYEHGRVDALLLETNSRGALGLRAGMHFRYQA